MQIEKVARLSYGRLVAILAARTGSVSAAADALSDALVKALETWPIQGIPARPEAWLVAAAKNRIADFRRHHRVATQAETHLLLLDEERTDDRLEVEPDRTLSLMFVCAHPAIATSMRTPLMLQLVLGLDARRMSGAFLISPKTLGQRLTRARAKIETAGIGFSMPAPADMCERLDHVLDAIYAAYTVGADGHAAGDAKSSLLAQEALWLASLVASQMPGEAEAQALFALILYCEARRPARVGFDGRFVPLSDQDPALWDAAMMRDADCAMRLAARNPTLGRFQIEAAIQAAHAVRRARRPTDWNAIAQLYAGLVALCPTTGAITGFAAALSEAQGPEVALSILETANVENRASYQPWWAVRAHLLFVSGNKTDASSAYDRAIALTSDSSVRAFLTYRKIQMQ